MVVTRKKTISSTVKELVDALEQFAYLLDGQKEDEAAADLRIAKNALKENKLGSDEAVAALKLIDQGFGDLHELDVYTQHKPAPDKWSEADELFHWSTKTLNLLRRIYSDKS